MEMQSWAERLIEQLPIGHEGRSSWLMNYGTSDEAHALRMQNNLIWSYTSNQAIKKERVLF